MMSIGLCKDEVPGMLHVSTLQSVRQDTRRTWKILLNDWHGSRSLSFGLVVLLLSSLVVAAYFLNHPQPELAWDSPDYLLAAQNIVLHGKLVDQHRTPGYPLSISLVSLVAGLNNHAAPTATAAIFFVLAVLEVYILTLLILKRAWIALIVALLVGTNTYLLSY